MALERNSRAFAGQYIFQVASLLTECPIDSILEVLDLLGWARERERKIFLFGNGGSAATASHFACDLSKGTLNGSEKRFKVLCLTDNVPLITAWANDSDYADTFSEQLGTLLEAGDVAFGISGSGNSLNVIRAIERANLGKAKTVGLTGFDGGRLAQLVDIAMIVPSYNMQQVEDLHLIIVHLITSYLRLGEKGVEELHRMALSSAKSEATA